MLKTLFKDRKTIFRNAQSTHEKVENGNFVSITEIHHKYKTHCAITSETSQIQKEAQAYPLRDLMPPPQKKK